MKVTLKIVSRLIIAVVFIFSGFVKCVDPTGFAIKMEEYLAAFGMDFLSPLSMTMSILMCAAEFLVGVMILFNLKIKWAIWLAVALMVFFTPLTLWLAITNKVTDCGCFGDAIVLTNFQTFLKNVFLDLFLVILFINRNRYKYLVKPMLQTAGVAGFAVLILGFEFYNLSHLPVIDFMPYKIGANIPSGMVVPAGAPTDEYKTTLFYEKNGETREFSLDNYPKDDPTWKWKDTKSDLINKGYVPPIHDFNIQTPDGQDVTDMILSDSGYSLLLVYESLKKASLKNIGEINRLADLAISKGYKVYGLTSSVPEEIEVFKEKAKATYPIYMLDGTTLKTMIRSNPGLILIKGGTVKGKWHHKQAKHVKDF
ncbi:MAG: BT_3928 family protein [Bacteroidales bacterium]|jgi:uncharacterized membrane protein YphA (DoxX/SURF4 family)